MSFLASVWRGVTSLRKALKNIKKYGSKSKAVSKAVKDSIITFAISVFLVFAIIGGMIYSVTGAVSEAFSWLKDKATSGGISIEDYIDNMTDEDLKALEDATGAYFNPKKLKGYMKEERDSVPSSITGTEHINNNGAKSSRQVTLDTKSFVDKYKTNWEFIASVDLASFEAGDGSKTNAVTHSKGLRSVFKWATDKYSRDVTNFSKKWVEETEYDPTTGQTITVKNTKDNAQETFVEVKTPLAIPETVDTAFGQDIYSVTENILVEPKVWSNPIIRKENVRYEDRKDKLVDDLSKPIYDTKKVYQFKGENGKLYKAYIEDNHTISPGGDKVYTYKGTDKDKYGNVYHVYEYKKLWMKQTLLINSNEIPSSEANQDMVYHATVDDKVHTGKYEQKQLYKTITIKTYDKEIVAEEIYEDRVSNVKSNFNPTKFITFLNACGLSVTDLDLVKEVLINIPNGNGFIEKIDQIINGGYGDINDGITGGGGVPGGGGSFTGVLPLYIQWDERWGNQPYAGENIAKAGCAPTTMAMVITGLGGNVSGMDLNGDKLLDPSESAKYATANGYAAHMQGSYDSIIPGMSKAAGLNCTNTRSIDEVYNALSVGKVVVANVVPGTIINGFHFLALTGVDNNGKITMNDPNSKENSAKGWEKSVISRESQNFWIIDNPNLSDTTKFIMKIRMGSIENYLKYGVYPSITMSQGALESGWGKSKLATMANNLYGVKADTSWTGPTLDLPTTEYVNGVPIQTIARWRVFNSWADSTINHGQFLFENPRYTQHGVFSAKNYKEQAHALRRAGYATDPNYPSLLIDLIEDFNLQLYDEIAANMKKGN